MLEVENKYNMRVYCFKKSASRQGEEGESSPDANRIKNEDKYDTMSIFIDGVLKSKSGNEEKAVGMQFSNIRHSVLFRGFKGNIASVIVYNTELTSTEVGTVSQWMLSKYESYKLLSSCIKYCPVSDFLGLISISSTIKAVL